MKPSIAHNQSAPGIENIESGLPSLRPQKYSIEHFPVAQLVIPMEFRMKAEVGPRGVSGVDPMNVSPNNHTLRPSPSGMEYASSPPTHPCWYFRPALDCAETRLA